MGINCRNCGVEIHFDHEKKSKTGKFIPLEYNGSPHQCPMALSSTKKKFIHNPSDSNNPNDPNYVASTPCMACAYYNRKCRPNDPYGHFAKW